MVNSVFGARSASTHISVSAFSSNLTPFIGVQQYSLSGVLVVCFALAHSSPLLDSDRGKSGIICCKHRFPNNPPILLTASAVYTAKLFDEAYRRPLGTAGPIANPRQRPNPVAPPVLLYDQIPLRIIPSLYGSLHPFTDHIHPSRIIYILGPSPCKNLADAFQVKPHNSFASFVMAIGSSSKPGLCVRSQSWCHPSRCTHLKHLTLINTKGSNKDTSFVILIRMLDFGKRSRAITGTVRNRHTHLRRISCLFLRQYGEAGL